MSNFRSARDIDDEREATREARKMILEKAKMDFEKRKAREDLAKLRGEDKWMLPELDAVLQKSKDKKSKKSKKSKKHKKEKKAKKSKHRDSSSDSDSSDDWVEKPTVETPLQRDDWMNAASIIPTFSKSELTATKRTSMVSEEETARKLAMEKPGQSAYELNPYWKNGGTGLPPKKEEERDERRKLEKSSTSRHSRSRSRSPRRKNPSSPNETTSSKKRFRPPSEERSTTGTLRQSASQPRWMKPSQEKKPPSINPSSSSESSSEDEKEQTMAVENEKIWTEQEMNSLNAKIIKAEIMGQQDVVNSLKRTLATARQQIERMKLQPGSSKEKVVILTRTDAKGGQHPLPTPQYGEDSLKGSRGKGKNSKVETHQSGKRVRYFADDDKYSLSEMFQREKIDTAEDQNGMFSRLAGSSKRLEKTNSDFDLDDMLESRANRQVDSVALEARDRQRAIIQHEKREKTLDACTYCLDSQAIQKHLIIAIGQKSYLCLPAHQSLVDGHCFIVPRSHSICSTQLDEDVWAEIQMFQRVLTKMFLLDDADAIFFETAMNLRRFPHMAIECIPLPISSGETAPIYFKKALLECETEWAMNKKVIDLQGKDVRKAIPKGLPYFYVDFGTQPGFAHIIEDEPQFPTYFAQEILGGILDVDPQLWRRPRRENFDRQKQKVLNFAAKWKEHDFTAKQRDD